MKARLEIEQKLNITVFLPQICYFCKDEVTMFGRVSDSLCFHSLDGDHGNWEPSNKVPTHKGCHHKYHNSGEKNANYGKGTMLGKHHAEKAKQKMSRIKIGKPRSKEAKQKISDSMSGEDGGAKKAVKTRRERYGPSGVRDPEARRRAIKEGIKKARQLRDEKHGS